METTFKQLDRPVVRYIRERIFETLQPLSVELGVMFDVGNCSFKPHNCRFQLKLAVLNSDGEAITEEMEAFIHHALHYGLSPDDLGKEFILQGKAYTICGLNSKSRKYPLIGKSSDGLEYTFTLDAVFEGLFQDKP
jgi:hypothetical protein